MPVRRNLEGGERVKQSLNVGRVIVLNGVPRAGKTSIAREIQSGFPGFWMNLGVDHHMLATPERLLPGVGLRPGSNQVAREVEDVVPVLYAALYDSIRAHALHGLNVVVDAKHHDAYSIPRHILADCARRMSGIAVLFVGVQCTLEAIWTRRDQTWGHSASTASADVVASVELGQVVTHRHPVPYDLIVDTTHRASGDCATDIWERLCEPPAPTAFERLALMT